MSISNNTTKLQSLMDKINALPEAGAGIEAHNMDTTAHADIRNEITELADNVVYMDTTDNENVENPDGVIIIDSQLSSSSTNPVQNKVITEKMNEKVDKTALSLGIGADGLIYIHVNGSPVGNGIAQSASGDVFGYVDADNNIILTGVLASGTYNVKYELEDGTTVDIGQMEFSENVPGEEVVVNWIPISTDEDDNLFVGTNGEKGYKTGYRLSNGSGLEKEADGYEVTGFIPAKKNDVIYIKNMDISTKDSNSLVTFYDSTKTPLSGGASSYGMYLYTMVNSHGTSDGNIYSFTLNPTAHSSIGTSLKYIRISNKSITDDSIITVNQPIIDDNNTNTKPSGNLADPTSTDWADGYRISSSSDTGLKAVDGFVTTNFIPAKSGDILRIKGIDITHMINGNYSTVASYKNDKTISVVLYTGTTVSTSPGQGAKDVVSVNGDVCTYTILLLGDGTQHFKDYDEYIRITGKYMDGYTAEDVVITINEEIV